MDAFHRTPARSSPRAATPSLLTAIALLAGACAHTPADSVKDRLERRMPDDRCADDLPGGATEDPGKDRIVQVVFNGDVFLGLSASARVVVLDPDTQTTRMLWRGRFGALAEDGSVGLAFGPSPTKGIALEVWDLASDQKLGARSFDEGLVDLHGPQALAVSRRAVVVRQAEAECQSGNMDASKDGPGCQDLAASPGATIVHWALGTDTIARGLIDQACGAQSMFSRDGRTFLCVSSDGDHVSWNDLASGAWPSSLRPASDWRRPRPTKHASQPVGAVDLDLPLVAINSARLSPDGTAVYLAYRRSAYPDEADGLAPRRGWRLERWTPGDPSTRIKVLASEPTQLCTDLLAVSPDGKLVSFGGAHHRAAVRRAPDFAAAPLPGNTVALSAAFSSDGAWLVTGHADGHLELWDTKTLTSRLTVHPSWHPED